MSDATVTRRISALTLVGLLIGLSSGLPVAQAIPRPSVDPGRVPADGKPGPDQPMRQSNICARTITVAEPNVTVPAPGYVMLNVSKAWQYSTGNGVAVAVIDTGVNPSPRLPVVPGGDYIMGGDGLMDCDAHGTIVASLIAAAPYLKKGLIPANAYGLPADVPSFGVSAILMTTADMDSRAVSDFASSLRTEIKALQEKSPVLENLNPQDIVTEALPAPLHPAALEAYRKLGLLK